MRMDDLLEKLQLEALDEWDKAFAKRSLENAREKAKLIWSPPARAVEDRKRLIELQQKTTAIEDELKLEKELEAETKRYAKAAFKLKQSRMTPQERKAWDEETRRFQILLSNTCLEQHPDWRLQK